MCEYSPKAEEHSKKTAQRKISFLLPHASSSGSTEALFCIREFKHGMPLPPSLMWYSLEKRVLSLVLLDI